MIKDILNGAADVLDEKGWCQGRYQNDKGEYCPAGAMIHYADSLLELEGVKGVDIAMRILHDEVNNYVTSWNDKPERTKEEVISALRSAAQKVDTSK